MSFQNLYFVAIIPPQNILEEVTAIKAAFAKNYNCSKALRVIPHITLKAPFKLSSSAHTQLLNWFGKIPPIVKPFITELKNFGTFANKNSPVIFIKPVVSDHLMQLQSAIIHDFEKHYPQIPVSFLEHHFKPHMTIAYRDLKPDAYQRAWEVYKDKPYEAVFEVCDFCLLQHDTKQWNIIASNRLMP
ncbi:2'-5' RNA ligase family protein [Olivibacter sp. SDN3]|uniref:2'-5' RNA ligase family protein n=1 Tax=Olivibacter sp. SDN3 TaxID=2764720 RepID=UPI001651AD79|nr:2'-5' RNA ligase family protein [Olivibacter sp. SDN3]QNL51066.1 2'-5' RNA ligase family protein [Olivibacter sp. SDN3]